MIIQFLRFNPSRRVHLPCALAHEYFDILRVSVLKYDCKFLRASVLKYDCKFLRVSVLKYDCKFQKDLLNSKVHVVPEPELLFRFSKVELDQIDL